MTAHHDIVVIGGGPVGAAFALALRDSGLSIAMLEARTQPITDERPLAISHGSRLILERLGIWQGLKPATPIEHIHVSQRGGFGRVGLSAAEVQVPALGYVTDYTDVAAVCVSYAQQAVDYRSGVRVTGVHAEASQTRVDYVDDQGQGSLHAHLVIVADGGVLEGCAPQKKMDYRQRALTALVRAERGHDNIAYERFAARGPLALLPYQDCYALVWTMDEARADALSKVCDTDFLNELQSAFGHRRGQLTEVSRRASYPLFLRYVTDIAARGVVMVGNAAQALHPVAGQGFNLGLRDAWELAQQVRTTTVRAFRDERTLQAVRNRRRMDRYSIIAATDGLVRLFSNEFFLLPTLRGVGMTVLSSLPAVRDFLARRMIFGVRG